MGWLAPSAARLGGARAAAAPLGRGAAAAAIVVIGRGAAVDVCQRCVVEAAAVSSSHRQPSGRVGRSRIDRARV